MNWSDAFLTTAIEEHCRKQPPPDLADRILQRARTATGSDRNPESQRTSGAPRPRNQFAAAAILALAAATVLGVWHVASDSEAQDPPSLLPLQRGASSVYRVTGPSGTWSYTETVLGSARRGDRDYHLVVAHRPELQTTIRSRLIAIDDRGIWQEQSWSGDFSASPAFQIEPAPRRHLPLPATAGDSWQWTYEWGGTQTDHDAEVLAVNETCTVPAGTFRTVHVRSTTRTNGEVTIEDRWYARGIGVVRRLWQRGKQPGFDAQLVRRSPAPPTSRARMALPALLAKSEMHALGMPDEVRVVELGFEALRISSRFLRVRYKTDWQLWRMTADRLVAFDAKDLLAWQALIADERLFEPADIDPMIGAAMLCGVAGRLEATDKGYEVRGEAFVIRWNGFEGQATVDMEVLLPASAKGKGNAEVMSITLELDKGRVVKIGPR